MSTDTRNQVREWIEEKDSVESKINTLVLQLQKLGFGMSGGLVDAEGFPLPDVDVIFEVRSLRNEIAILQTDHLGLMKKIEQGLLDCFNPEKIDDKEEELDIHSLSIKDQSKESELEEFCKVKAVQFGSPAEEAGLKAEDLITSFGFVNINNHENLSNIRNVVVANENREILVDVIRAGERRQLKLVPKRWRGQGLLGCQVVPL